MQLAVLDRPVIDKTGLQGRYDFTLTWTPDETQFASFGVRIPTSTDPNAPPVLFTAIQEQIGLKLDSVRAPVEVMVIDRVEGPPRISSTESFDGLLEERGRLAR